MGGGVGLSISWFCCLYLVFAWMVVCSWPAHKMWDCILFIYGNLCEGWKMSWLGSNSALVMVLSGNPPVPF